jgi:hypothetical protein
LPARSLAAPASSSRTTDRSPRLSPSSSSTSLSAKLGWSVGSTWAMFNYICPHLLVLVSVLREAVCRKVAKRRRKKSASRSLLTHCLRRVLPLRRIHRPDPCTALLARLLFRPLPRLPHLFLLLFTFSTSPLFLCSVDLYTFVRASPTTPAVPPSLQPSSSATRASPTHPSPTSSSRRDEPYEP